MKSILISIQPQWVEKILNGEKAIEVRKKFPKDYVGWVYIYCTKGELFHINNEQLRQKISYTMNGKVVARFWCDKVQEILLKPNGNYYTNTLSNNKLITQSCLSQKEMFDYLGGNWHKAQYGNYWFGGYAIHISQLEIFDKPKELSEFHKIVNIRKCDTRYCDDYYTCNKCIHSKLSKAPQNYCYIIERKN